MGFCHHPDANHLLKCNGDGLQHIFSFSQGREVSHHYWIHVLYIKCMRGTHPIVNFPAFLVVMTSWLIYTNCVVLCGWICALYHFAMHHSSLLYYIWCLCVLVFLSFEPSATVFLYSRCAAVVNQTRWLQSH